MEPEVQDNKEQQQEAAAADAAVKTPKPKAIVNRFDTQSKRGTTSALSHGTFVLDLKQTVNFVFMPKYFVPSDGETLVSSVLAELDIPAPNISFIFDKGTSVPNQNRISPVIDGINEACAQTDSLHVISRPFMDNELSELVCHSSKRYEDCQTLGLFVLRHITDVQESDILNATAARVEEVAQLIHVTSDTSGRPDKSWPSYEAGFLPKVSHVLVFAEHNDRGRFCGEFAAQYSPGMLAVGGSANIHGKGIECLRTGRPIFAFDGTGGTAQDICNLIEYGHRKAKFLKAESNFDARKREEALEEWVTFEESVTQFTPYLPYNEEYHQARTRYLPAEHQAQSMRNELRDDQAKSMRKRDVSDEANVENLKGVVKTFTESVNASLSFLKYQRPITADAEAESTDRQCGAEEIKALIDKTQDFERKNKQKWSEFWHVEVGPPSEPEYILKASYPSTAADLETVRPVDSDGQPNLFDVCIAKDFRVDAWKLGQAVEEETIRQILDSLGGTSANFVDVVRVHDEIISGSIGWKATVDKNGFAYATFSLLASLAKTIAIDDMTKVAIREDLAKDIQRHWNEKIIRLIMDREERQVRRKIARLKRFPGRTDELKALKEQLEWSWRKPRLVQLRADFQMSCSNKPSLSETQSAVTKFKRATSAIVAVNRFSGFSRIPGRPVTQEFGPGLPLEALVEKARLYGITHDFISGEEDGNAFKFGWNFHRYRYNGNTRKQHFDYRPRDTISTMRNFPEHFNPEAAMVIDVNEDGVSLDELQNKITLAMSHAFDGVPELGGSEKDLLSLQHAVSMKQLLIDASKRYRCESTFIVTIFRALFVMTAVSGVLEGQVAEQASLEPEYHIPFWSSHLSLVLPLLLGLVATLYSTYRPMQKFAALWYAAKKLEGEIYRFRTRTKQYRSVKSSLTGRGHRRAFARECDLIVKECGSDDVRSGSAQLADPALWTDQEKMPLSTCQWIRCRICCGRVKLEDVNKHLKVRHVLDAKQYIDYRLVPALQEAQKEAPVLHRKLRTMQFFIILGSSVCVAFQATLPQWTPVVLSMVASFEFFVSCKQSAIVQLAVRSACIKRSRTADMQLERQLPGVNGTALALLRVLLWWDGLSLVQQRTPGSKDQLVDVVERALLMQHQGFVQGALANLGKDLGTGPLKEETDDTKKGEEDGSVQPQIAQA